MLCEDVQDKFNGDKTIMWDSNCNCNCNYNIKHQQRILFLSSADVKQSVASEAAWKQYKSQVNIVAIGENNDT